MRAGTGRRESEGRIVILETIITTRDESGRDHIAPMGIRVPDDIALIGFSNAQPALLGALGLTTMAQPYEQMGREAMTLLLDRHNKWHQRLPTQEVRLPMKLIVRTSCGASASIKSIEPSS